MLSAMKNFKSILFLFILAFTFSVNAFDIEIVDKGYRIASESIMKDYTLMRLAPSQNVIAKHIVKINYKIEIPI